MSVLWRFQSAEVVSTESVNRVRYNRGSEHEEALSSVSRFAPLSTAGVTQVGLRFATYLFQCPSPGVLGPFPTGSGRCPSHEG